MPSSGTSSPRTSITCRAISRVLRPTRPSATNARNWKQEWDAKAHRIFYMATPPSLFGEIPKCLGEAGLANDRERARIVDRETDRL